MSNHTTWVLVANAAQAKIYRLVRFPKIEEVAYMEHPQSRMAVRDLVSSAPGRGFESMGTTRHAYESKTNPHQVEVDAFAKTLGDFLSESFRQKDFSRLYLFASPAFLGTLRPHLDAKVRDAIISEQPKDLTEHRKEDIENLISEI